MLKKFQDFAIKGNAFDLAVGVIIGAAFGGIVASLVGDIFMPVVGAVTGGLDSATTSSGCRARSRPTRWQKRRSRARCWHGVISSPSSLTS